MKIMFYTLRPFDELDYAKRFSQEYGIDFAWTSDYPRPENIQLAQGCEAVCTTPCDMSADILDRFAALGVRYLPCRSIGYDHIDLAGPKNWGCVSPMWAIPPRGWPTMPSC